MKKLLLTLLIGGAALNAKAQWFVAGDGGLSYVDEVFSMTLRPYVGYEINEQFAVGFGAGVSVFDDETCAVINHYVRYTIWNNDQLAIDVKALSQITTHDGYSINQLGVAPSVRFKINDQWQVAADCGFFGACCADGDWTPAFAAKNVNVNATVIYRFSK